jgi:hypothetical protein
MNAHSFSKLDLRIHFKKLDPDPHNDNADPKHWC